MGQDGACLTIITICWSCSTQTDWVAKTAHEPGSLYIYETTEDDIAAAVEDEQPEASEWLWP